MGWDVFVMSEDYYVLVPDPRTPGKIVRAKAARFKVLKEDWNEYELEDGTIVKVKLTVAHV